MIHPLAPLAPNPNEVDLIPALENPAIARCQMAWKLVYRRVRKLKNSSLVAQEQAGEAFRKALPPLSGLENIRNFIACVTFAMASGIFKEETCTKLLYAAQLALNAVLPRPKAKGSRGA